MGNLIVGSIYSASEVFKLGLWNLSDYGMDALALEPQWGNSSLA